jgi:Tol biopolymer transport system component
MNEVVNGFDISPNRKKLLIPVIRKKDAPFLIEYDFATGHKDTLHTTVFDKFEGSWSLWVRYSHDGSKILYDLYPYGTFGLAFYGSQTGIIDRSSLSGKIIHTSPDNESTWITVFPQWSPDDREIMCCTASISTEPAGFVDAFGVYILKNIK